MRRAATLQVVTVALLLAAWGGCAADEPVGNSNNDNQPIDGGLPGPKLYSISPVEGPVAGGTLVELSGADFWGELTVTFGGQPATEVTVVSGERVTCVSPPSAMPGPVAVRVRNVQQQWDELPEGFTYVEAHVAEVTWCALSRPAAVQTGVGQPTAPIFGRVLAEGLTEAPGPGGGISAQLGYGPVGSDPGAAPGWTWADAVYAADASALYDEYVASLTPDASGTFDYAYRFSADGGATWLHCDLDASDNGYSPDQAGALTVGGGGGEVTVTAVALPRGAVAGGAVVTVTGSGFASGAGVSFGAAPSPQVTFVDSGELTAVVPPGSAGAVDVTVENPGGGAGTLVGGFEYLLVGATVVDGDLSDWDAAHLVATNAVLPSSWGVENELHALYVAYDATTLYAGIDGTVNADNAIVAYLDVDFGGATGIADTAAITDQNGAFDATVGGHATNGSLVFAVTGFGADFAFGSKGMSGIVDAWDDNAGWRSLANPGDLPWLVGTVAAGTGQLECAIPLATLWPGGVPQTGAQVALVVKIADPDGQSHADQTLPEEAATSTVSQVLVFSLFPAGTY